MNFNGVCILLSASVILSLAHRTVIIDINTNKPHRSVADSSGDDVLVQLMDNSHDVSFLAYAVSSPVA